MKKIIGFISCMALFYFIGMPQDSYAFEEGETCSNARCHTVGEGYCLPGNAISFRSRCPEFNCLVGEDCTWEPGFDPE